MPAYPVPQQFHISLWLAVTSSESALSKYEGRSCENKPAGASSLLRTWVSVCPKEAVAVALRQTSWSSRKQSHWSLSETPATQMFEMLGLTHENSRVPNQNSVSQAWYIVEIHHSGWEPSKYYTGLWSRKQKATKILLRVPSKIAATFCYAGNSPLAEFDPFMPFSCCFAFLFVC